MREAMMRRATTAIAVTLVMAASALAQDAAAPAKSQPETLAVAFMRTVINAERQYKKKHAKYATSLAALVGSGSFTRRMVKPDRGDYTVQFHGKDDGYIL